MPAASASSPGWSHAPAEARLLVGFEKGVSAERHAHIVTGAEGRIAQRFKSVRGGRLSVVESRKGVAQAVLRRRLAARDGIAYVENDDTITAQESRPPHPRGRTANSPPEATTRPLPSS